MRKCVLHHKYELILLKAIQVAYLLQYDVAKTMCMTLISFFIRIDYELRNESEL